MSVVDVSTLSLLEQPGLEADETLLELATVEDGDTLSTLIIYWSIGAINSFFNVWSLFGLSDFFLPVAGKEAFRLLRINNFSMLFYALTQGLGDVSFSTEIAGLEVLLLLK